MCSLGLNLNQRNIIYSGSVSNYIFNISCYSVTNLFLKILKIKCVESVQLYELTVIADFKADSSSYGYRNAEIRKSRIINIKKRNSKFYLNYLCKIDEVNFGLERSSALVCQAYNTCKHREVFCFDNLIKRTDNEILHYSVRLFVNKYSNLTIFHSK